MSGLPFVQDDGGRTDAGFRGEAGDCVTRAIAIASGRPYRDVYDALHQLAREMGAREPSPRGGVLPDVYRAYLDRLGFAWTATMQIGSGCTVHLALGELPDGALVVRLSRHLTAVVHGTIRDTFDPSRGGTRCAYGYWRHPE